MQTDTHISSSVLIQNCSLADIERMINRAVGERMKEFAESMKPKPDALLRRHDAAKRLGVSLPTLDKYGQHGILHPRHVGGRVYYPESELNSYIIAKKK